MLKGGEPYRLTTTKKITVEVPGLVELTVGPDDHFRLTGNQDKTQHPKCPGTAIRHSQNHFLTFANGIRIRGVSNRWFQKFGETLGINDISLRTGGLFDICSDWEVPHHLHRLGASVDIDSTSHKLVDGKVKEINIKDRVLLLEVIALFFDGVRKKEDPLHIEFPP